MRPDLAAVLAAFERRFPPALKEDWDRVGLAAGDPASPVSKVMFAVDPVVAVLEEAVDWGADLLITHHPLLLRPVSSVAATTFKGALVHRAIRAGVALYAAHTNADAAPGGVADALADIAGLVDRRPLVPASAPAPYEAAFVPSGEADQILKAMAGAGAGLGRVGPLDRPTTLRALAARLAGALPATAHGVRVAGPPEARVASAAILGGAGDSLFDEVRASGADVYITADLRHHPASEARERAAFDGGGAPYLIDLSHSASEWPWLAHAAEQLRQDVAGTGGAIETRVSRLVTDPWTFRLDPS